MTDFQTLYRSYGAVVRRFARFLCGNEALADDITSETFVRVWKARGTIREATVKAYLFTIARNLYRDHLRAHKPMHELDESMCDPRIDLENQTAQRAELEVVMRMLQQLPEIDRAALLMRVQEEMPYEEIAVALKLPLTTVKVKVHRARLKLIKARAALEEVPSCR
jgi:RNA polymerase sigma-70 factor (ECF subfamily)